MFEYYIFGSIAVAISIIALLWAADKTVRYINSINTLINRLQNEISKLANTHLDIRKERDELADQVHILSVDNESLQDKNDSLIKENYSILNENQKLLKLYDDLQCKNNELEAKASQNNTDRKAINAVFLEIDDAACRSIVTLNKIREKITAQHIK